MKNNSVRAYVLAGIAAIIAGFIGYVSGAFDLYLGRKPAEVTQQETSIPANTPEEIEETPEATQTQAAQPEAAAPEIEAAETDSETETNQAPAEEITQQQAEPDQVDSDEMARQEDTTPAFDVLRVEGDGSIVVAGKAAAGATVELSDGTTALGKAIAGPDGAFVIVLDNPLQAGDHQITLRATAPDGSVVTSVQTAVVAIPEQPDGQVLAMVEEPGKPAQLLTVPEPFDTGEAPADTAEAPADTAEVEPAPVDTAEVEPAGTDDAKQAQAEAAPAPVVTADEQPEEVQKPAVEASRPQVSVAAVEIDGEKIFIAGRADAGRKVRVYANEILLGEAITSPDGHFLVETSHDLAVGEYIIRVDALDLASDKVVARAQVPFQREPGEVIAAVAPEDENSSDTAPAGTDETDETVAAAPVVPVVPPASVTPVAPETSAQVETEEEQPAITTAPKLQQTEGSVIIRRGDTLWHISRRVYGHGIRYSTIYLANQDQIADPDRIWPGQLFKVPETSNDGEPADFQSLGDQITVQP
ncbi:Ig-like domain-containing protein [Aquamicrobium segne]|uniref:Ig-like domain-containing protein n=1 Tax=Aquamicrobium segne TaxID=469547 RepID=A0ABW0GXX4_9HYPH